MKSGPLIAPYLTLLPETAAQREHSLREAFNGLRYIVRYGVAWRALPHDLPPWHSVYDQAQRWLRGARAMSHFRLVGLTNASGASTTWSARRLALGVSETAWR